MGEKYEEKKIDTCIAQRKPREDVIL